MSNKPARPILAAVEIGPKGKRFVAHAPQWPGWSRGAKTEDEAVATLTAYRSRYRPVAELAGLTDEFEATGEIVVEERYPGTGSTDFWGISFASASSDLVTFSDEEWERKLALLQASWEYFDQVAARVSPNMQRGPRGGGKDRDDIINHTFGSERTQMAPKVGVKTPPGVMLTPEGLKAHREDFFAALREYHAAGKKLRSWSLSFLLRHTAYHSLDHAWEMEDKDLSKPEEKAQS